MKRALLGLLCALSVTTVFAGPLPGGPHKLSPDEVARLGGVLDLTRTPQKVATDLLLFELPSGMSPGPHRLEATFSLRGKPYFKEQLTLDLEKVEEGQAIELLVWHEERRAEILKLARNPENQIKVSIELDGERVLSLPLDRLRTRTEMLAQVGFTPVVAMLEQESDAGDLERIFSKSHGTYECEGACENDYRACTDQCWDQGCIQECQYWYDQCHYSCPKRCDGPKVRDYSRRIIVQQTLVGYACIEDYRNPFAGGKIYNEFYTAERIESRRETTYCDGTKTDVLLSYYYNYYYCWAISYPERSCYPYYSSAGIRLCF
jgi:hypothetical protein